MNANNTTVTILNHNAIARRMVDSRNWSCSIVDRDCALYGVRGRGTTKAAAIAACLAEASRVAGNLNAGVMAAQQEAWDFAMTRGSGY